MQAIRKQVAVAKLNLKKVNIAAPFEGIIITKEIEQGAFAEVRNSCRGNDWFCASKSGSGNSAEL